MKAVFIELPAFERHRTNYLDDDDFRGLQNLLMLHPEAGDLPVPAACANCASPMYGVVRVSEGPASDLLLVGYRIAVLAVHALRQGRDGGLDAASTQGAQRNDQAGT